MIASQTTECSCKHIVSVSLGSSERNAKSTLQLKGQTFIIERLGTDGNLQKARQLLEELDGRVDALGLGGTDLYVYAGGRRYTFRESAKHSKCISTLFPFENSPGVCTLTWLRSMCVNTVFTGSSACIFPIQRNNSPSITIKRFISLKIKKFYILGIRKFLQQIHHIVYVFLQTFTTTVRIHDG